MKPLRRLIGLFLVVAAMGVYSCSGDRGETIVTTSDTTNPSVTTNTRPVEAFPDTEPDPNFRDTNIVKPKLTDANAKKVEADNARIIAANPVTYKDGSYKATIDFFDPTTSYRSTYSLKVYVQHGWVTKITFPNDGYMGNDHITPAELDVDGGCNVYGEHGKVYTVEIDHP